MSIVACSEIWSGRTGTSGESDTWVRVFRLRTDDPADGPQTVCQHSELPEYRDEYRAGNDYDESAKLKQKTPTQGASRLDWTVACQYAPDSESESNESPDGSSGQNPFSWNDEVDISTISSTVPVIRARMMSEKLGIPGRKNGSLGPVVNSAGTIYDPPLETTGYVNVVRIVRNHQSPRWDESNQYRNTVNSSDVVLIPRTPAIKMGLWITKGEGFCLPFHITSKIINDTHVWVHTYEVHIKRGGWIVEVPDRGFCTTAAVASPGEYGQNDSPLIPRSIFDDAGMLSAEPVLLDGHGAPLASGEPAVYIKYEVYDTLPWRDLLPP